MKLVTKITLMLAFVSLVPLLILGAVAAYCINGIRDNAMDVGMRTLMDAERANLAQLAEVGARGIDRVFRAYQEDVIGLHTGYDFVRAHPKRFSDSYRDDLYPDKPHPGLPGYGYVHSEWGMYGDFDGRFPTTAYVRKSAVARSTSDEKLAAEISESLHAAKLIEPAFVSLARKYPDTLDLVWIVMNNGAANVWPPYDLKAMIARNPALPDLDESERVYVRLLNPSNNPGRDVLWLQPYLDPYKRVWITSCIAPLYDGDKFIGSIGIDILLSAIRQKVLDIGVRESGYAFLIDSKGVPIVLPPRGIADLAWEETQKTLLAEMFKANGAQGGAREKPDIPPPTALGMTPRSDVAALLREMTAQKSGVERVTLSGEQKLVAYAPLRTPAWSLGLVLPVKEALAPAMRASQTIGEGTQRIRWQFMFILLLVAMLSVSLGWIAKHQLTPKIRRLMGFMVNISQGKLNPSHLRTDGRDEFAQIERSLGEMHSLLEEKERCITVYVEKLEALIRERAEARRNTPGGNPS
jgi:hypothetical protein